VTGVQTCALPIYDFDRERLSNVYRQILLERLLSYRQGGTKGLSPYEDGPSSYDLASILKTHLLRFQYLDAYFPMIQQYILEYPNFRDKRVSEFFCWAKERRGDKPVITLRHVFSMRIGEDYIVVNKLIYANHYFLSSIGVIHLINDADKGPPRTLTVYEERTLTDLRGDVFEALGRNILRSNLEKSVVAGFKNVGKTMESRYVSASYDDFPFGLQPRDQR